MEMRIARASAVVVHRVRSSANDWFMEWQRDVSETAETFAGYRGTELYPPTSGASPGEWVAVIHFEDESSLQRWLNSSERASRLAKLRDRVENFDVKMLPGGFGAWFAHQASSGPPGWRMAAVVLLGLYPTVMLLTIFVGPYTSVWGMAASMLIGNLLSVVMLQYGVMPLLSKAFAPWLSADSKRRPTRILMGVLLIAALLVGLALLFREFTG